MMELIENIDEVYRNIKKFNHDLENNNALKKELSKFRHWYVFEDGEKILFGPSKFIGYKGIDIEIYFKYRNTRDDSTLDGRKTEEKLQKKFFKRELKNENLAEELVSFLKKYGKKQNKNYTINVAK